jgi:AcrR family transcriptional regulator
MTQQSHPYQQHRENQRERILDTAETLFITSGIDGVNMSAIAHAAKITRKTLYAYFTNKQEIAWEILRKIFESNRKNAPALEGTVVEKIEQFMLGMVHLMETNKAHGRFIVEFNSLYARETNADHMRSITGREQRSATFLSDLIEEGIEDGSLLPELDPELVSAAIWNLLSGMNSRFALLGDQIELEYEQPAQKIYREICRGYLCGIQNVQPKEKPDE